MTEDKPVELSRGSLKFWAYQGMVLEAGDGNEVGVHDLADFAQYAMKHFPDSKVIVHCYGLRVTKIEGTVGPRLDWRDWD